MQARERVRLMAMHEEELRRAAIERDELQGAMSSAQAHTAALSSKLRQSLVEADAQREAHTSALVERDGVKDHAVLLYGKLEEDEFALDYAHPLSMLHALAIVLTTWGW